MIQYVLLNMGIQQNINQFDVSVEIQTRSSYGKFWT